MADNNNDNNNDYKLDFILDSIYVDFSEDDAKCNSLPYFRSKKDDKDYENLNKVLFSSSEILEKYNISLDPLLRFGFETYNNVYKIQMSKDDINETILHFKDFIKNLNTLEKTHNFEELRFQNIYSNKFTQYEKENNKSLFFKVKPETYTFYCFSECFFEDLNTDKKFIIFFRF